MERAPTFVFFRLSFPNQAHGLVGRLDPICSSWTELQPDGAWIVGAYVAHGDRLSRVVRTAARWAADTGLSGLPLEVDDEVFFVPAATAAGTARTTRPRSGRAAPSCRPHRARHRACRAITRTG